MSYTLRKEEEEEADGGEILGGFILESAILLSCVPNITLVPRLSPLRSKGLIKDKSEAK